MVQAIDEWRATGQLPQARRNDLRNMVHGAVAARLMLDDGLGGLVEDGQEGFEILRIHGIRVLR